MEIFSMWASDKEIRDALVGKSINKIFINNEYLKFETNQGDVIFTVYGDCCSRSYFFDFYGVKRLLANRVVTDMQPIQLKEGDFNYIPYSPESKGDASSWEYISCYGWQITSEDPEFGEVTSVFSFRNSSNGYYGGSLELYSGNPSGLIEVTEDVLEVK